MAKFILKHKRIFCSDLCLTKSANFKRNTENKLTFFFRLKNVKAETKGKEWQWKYLIQQGIKKEF